MRFIYIATMIACIAAACASQRDVSEDKQLPENLEIQFGSGGGFTGLWTGYTIRGDGTVLKWQGRAAGQNAQKRKEISREAVHELWSALQANSFQTLSTSEEGNMTLFIRIQTKDVDKSISWPQSASSTRYQLENKLFKACEELVRM